MTRCEYPTCPIIVMTVVFIQLKSFDRFYTAFLSETCSCCAVIFLRCLMVYYIDEVQISIGSIDCESLALNF